MYKVFVNNLPLYIGDSSGNQDPEDAALYNCASKTDAKALLVRYTEGSQQQPVWVQGDKKQLFDWFFGDYSFIEAAGGLVRNREGAYLFIFRNGKWDIPKGKLEKNEDRREAALREVAEECGIEGHLIVKELPSTWHVYPYREHWAIKVTYWYLMAYEGAQTLVPQTEEGITAVEWRDKAHLDDIRANTFASITDIIAEIPASDK